MTYVPRGPCSRCGRYERAQGMGYFSVCDPCDDEGTGRGGPESLEERRTASGWTPAPTIYHTAYWVEPPTAYGQPGRMEWRPPRPRPTIIHAPILSDPVEHDGSHPGCLVCEVVSQRIKRRVVR